MFQICQRIPIGEHFHRFIQQKECQEVTTKSEEAWFTGCNIEGHYLDLGIPGGPGVNDTQYMKQCKKNAKKSSRYDTNPI